MIASTRAYKRRQQLQQRQARNRCPALECKIYVPAQRIACSDHWFSLPEELRDRINATYKRDRQAHLAAYREAVSLLTRRPTSPGADQ